MSDDPEEKIIDKIYIWLSEKKRKKNPVEGNNIFISRRMGDRYGLFIAKVRCPEGKMPCKVN